MAMISLQQRERGGEQERGGEGVTEGREQQRGGGREQEGEGVRERGKRESSRTASLNLYKIIHGMLVKIDMSLEKLH
jgi:hypothetical protein